MSMSTFLKSKGAHPTLFFGILVSIIASSRLLQYFLKTSGFSQGDSWAYNFGHNPDLANLSFTGQALRRWPIVLVNTFLGNDSLQILAQSIFSILAWSILVITLGKITRVSAYSLILITTLSASPQVVSWNSIHLSESYAISSGILTLCFLILYERKKSFPIFMAICLSLFFFLNTKPSNYLAFLAICSFMVLLKSSRSALRSLEINWVKTSILGLVILYSGILAINQSTSDLQTDGHGESYSAAQAVAVISNVNPLANVVSQSLTKTGNIKCLTQFSDQTPEEVTNSLKNECHTDEKWLTEDFQKWYISFIVRNPEYVFKTIATGFTAGNSPYTLYGGSISILPDPVTSLFFGERNYAIRLSQNSASNIPINTLEINSPIIFWTIISLTLLSLRKIKICLGNKANTMSVEADQLFGMVSIFGMFVMAISAISIPNEWFRQSIVGQIALLIAGIIHLERIVMEIRPKLRD
jgi:hypothetical protein